MSIIDLKDRWKLQKNQKAVERNNKARAKVCPVYNEGNSNLKKAINEYKQRPDTKKAIGNALSASVPMFCVCGAVAVAAGFLMHAHIPALVTTLAIPAAGCLWFMIQTDLPPKELVLKHGLVAAGATALAVPAALAAGSAGALVAGGAVLGTGIATHIVNYFRGCNEM